jgi:predicted MarR family transcription regulator
MKPAKDKKLLAKEGLERKVLGHRPWHLGLTPHEVLATEFEWSVIRFQQAFERYILQIAHIAGLGELSYSELVLLHVIGFADGPITLGLLARQLNADNVTNIQYGLRKLVGYQLVGKGRGGKGNVHSYHITDRGRARVEQYAHFRRQGLIGQTNAIRAIDQRLADSTQLIGMLTGVYDEAMRISATFSSSP